MRPSGIGGQAVIEGVMMKNKDQYAIAVRKPNNEIIVEKNAYVSISNKYTILKLPIFRGILAFIESMIIGTRTLTFSASFYEEEEVKPSKVESAFSKIFKDKAEAIAMTLTLMLSLVLAIGIFMVTPFFVANLLEKQIESDIILTIIEGCIRIGIFIAYVFAISQIKDIKRMFMYHGAEHKTINCLEQGFELTVENVKWQSKQHKRCGTSFMFLVMFVSIIFFIFIRVETIWLRVLTRILLVPIIAGVSYEFIRLAGKSESKIVNILSKPGLWLQGLTTKEPDDEMIEVAIQSVDAVFDWKGFLSQDKKKVNSSKNSKSNSQNSSTKNKKQNSTTRNNEKESLQKSKIPVMLEEDELLQESNSNDIQKQKNNKKINSGKGSSNKSRSNSSMSKQKIMSVNEETAATVEKKSEALPESIFGEEDDEILRALDRYLDEKPSNKD